MIRLSLLGISLLLLQSCGGEGQGIGMVESQWWHKTASAQVKRDHFRGQCLGFGFTDNTPEMAQCLQTQMNNSRSAANQRAQQAYQNYNATRMRTTTCNTFGNTITCNNW